MAEPLRDDHRRHTRERIVRAVTELVTEEHPAAVSVPKVAKRAGVGVATVYRYFPTKEALLDASSVVISADVREAGSSSISSFADLETVLPLAWRELASEHLPLARNQLASPLGRELRRRRWEAKQASTDAALHGIGIAPDSLEGRRLAALADVLTSSTALLELHDKAQIPVDEAAAFVLWGLRALIDATTDAPTDATPQESP